MMGKKRRIEIWFFLGVLLLAYGILILGAGIFFLFNPPSRPASLSELHPDIWWGALLLALGLIYSIRYWPFGATLRRE